MTLDVIVIVVTVLAAMFLRSRLFPGLFGLEPFSPVRNYLSLWPALVLFILARASVGLYPGYGMHPAEELKRQTVSTTALILVVLGGSALFQFSTVYSRVVLGLSGALLIFALPIVRSRCKEWLAARRIYGTPVWVVGNSPRSNQLAALMDENPTLGMRVGKESADVPEGNGGLRYCLVVPDGLEDRPLPVLLDRLSERFERVWLAPNLLDVASVWVTPRDLQGHLVLELRNNLLEARNRVIKRVLDLLLCLVCLPLVLPLMIVIALLIRRNEPGAVLLRQRRVGRNGKAFTILKFRTMRHGADKILSEHLESNPHAKVEWTKTRKLRNDPRVTGPGRFLRRTSLDELPQLLNIVLGDMSFVGPRPVMEDEVANYGDSAPLYQKVSPGLTGLTQVSGRSDLTYEDRVRLDTYYVRNWSIWLDLVILGRTLGAVTSTKGAY